MNESDRVFGAIRVVFECFPEPVSRVYVKSGLDSEGDKAFWVWVVLNPAASVDPKSFSIQTKIRNLLIKGFEEKGFDSLPYVSFRLEDEVVEPESTQVYASR